MAVLIRARSSNDGTNRVAISDGIVEGFDYQNTKSLASAISICSCIETMACPIRGQEAEIGKTYKEITCQ